MPLQRRWLAALALVACSSSPVMDARAPSDRDHPAATAGKPLSLWAQLPDADGLQVGTQVVAAGIAIGRVSSVDANERGARVEIALHRPVEVWSDAILRKRVTATLGAYQLEIELGGESGDAGPAHRLVSGDEILRVVTDDGVGEDHDEARDQLLDSSSSDAGAPAP